MYLKAMILTSYIHSIFIALEYTGKKKNNKALRTQTEIQVSSIMTKS